MGKIITKIGDIVKGRRVIDGKKYSPVAESLSYKSMVSGAEKLRRAGISARVITTLETYRTQGYATLYVPTSEVKRAKRLLKG